MNWIKDAPLWLVLPHQLFEDLPAGVVNVAIVEEELFFNQFRFHKQKLVIHRASMQYYAERLSAKGYRVRYFSCEDNALPLADLIVAWSRDKMSHLQLYYPEDDWLTRRITAAATSAGIRVEYSDTPQFILSREQVHAYFGGKKQFLQANFYSAQRKHFNVLMTAGKPEGGKWSFDEENRLRYPKHQKPPALPDSADDTDLRYLREAEQYVKQCFPAAPGELQGDFTYPVTHSGARRWLDEFLEKRFDAFGRYEDAMVCKEPLLHHSLLSVFLNNGLLLPRQVLDAALLEGTNRQLGLNEVEGFVRQLLGWREFIRGVYTEAGRKQRTRNYWQYRRKIPASFYNGTTGIAPVDIVIRKVLRNGYCHHIERLMVLSNFMLLCDFDPDAVYRWFMELFVDAYDWVMVPNVYGMGQFADGGMMSTKPYISSSNYLLKMGDFEKGEWTEVWDGLYWRFIDTHRDFFMKNPRMSVMVRSCDQMNGERQARLKLAAEHFLKGLDEDVPSAAS